MNVLASNKYYFSLFNDDIRQGGIIADLDNSEFCAYIKLQSYADASGDVKGYTVKGLTEILGMNVRTVKKSLLGLQDRELISIDDSNNINITQFVYNHTGRMEALKSKSIGKQVAKARREAKAQAEDAIITSVRTSANRLANEVHKLTSNKPNPNRKYAPREHDDV